MELPKKLAAWTSILGLFPEDIAQLISSLAKQLSPLIGAVNREETFGTIEPDGFAGLTTKANYERLLLTEWGLQEYFPDEFVRRAASGEHLFFELQKIEHSDDRHCFALFDCGPKQLGRPRLVQLVVLILLERRAAKMGATLSWGILQDNGHTVYSTVCRESIKAWLDHRTARDSNKNQLEDWMSTVRNVPECQGTTFDELWTVTPKTLSCEGIEFTQVKIVEPLLDLETINVSVESKKKKNAISLKLNNEPLNVRAIRDPFEEKNEGAHWERTDHGGQWVIGVSGMRFACFNSIGELALYKINRYKLSKPTPRRIVKFRDDRKLAGIFVSKKMSFSVSYDDKHVYVGHMEGIVTERKFDKPEYMVFSDKELAKIAVANGQNSTHLFILDALNTVSCVDLKRPTASLELYRANVAALGQSLNYTWLIDIDEQSNCRLQWYLGDVPVSANLGIGSIDKERSIFSHASGNWHKGSTGPFAAQVVEDDWEIASGSVHNRKIEKITIRPQDQAVGVISVRQGLIPGITVDAHSSKNVLIVVAEDRRTIRGVWEGGEQELLVLESEFKRGEVNPQHPIMHFVDKHNDLLAVNLLTGKVVFQLEKGPTG